MGIVRMSSLAPVAPPGEPDWDPIDGLATDTASDPDSDSVSYGVFATRTSFFVAGDIRIRYFTELAKACACGPDRLTRYDYDDAVAMLQAMLRATALGCVDV